MSKKELVTNIMTVIEWVTNNENNRKTYGKKVSNALHNVCWYDSKNLMNRVLMRVNKEELQKIHHDVVEAIY